MTLSIRIGLGADELPPSGETCSVCDDEIQGTVFYPYVFAGLEQYGEHIGAMCETCYKSIFNSSPTSEK